MLTLKKTAFISMMIFLCLNGFSQLSTSFNYSSVSRIGLGYQFSGKIWTELRIISNTIDEEFSPEVILGFNIVKKERHSVYAGLGVNLNVLSGISVPVGVEIFPIESFDRLSLRIEFEPTYTAFDSDNKLWLLSCAGIKYRFGARK